MQHVLDSMCNNLTRAREMKMQFWHEVKNAWTDIPTLFFKAEHMSNTHQCFPPSDDTIEYGICSHFHVPTADFHRLDCLDTARTREFYELVNLLALVLI